MKTSCLVMEVRCPLFLLILLLLSITISTCCPVGSSCLPLRTHFVDTNSTLVLSPNGTVTITCAVNCGQVPNANYTGYNIIEDWSVIGVDRSNNQAKQYYITQMSRRFSQDGGVHVSFDRTFSDQSEICTGTRDTERFSLDITANNTPKFETIYVFCGLGRHTGGGNRTPVCRFYDFDYMVEVNVLMTPTTPSPAACQTMTPNPCLYCPKTNCSSIEDTIIYSNDTDKQPLILLGGTSRTANITCTKLNGTITEVKITRLDEAGATIDGSELLYTDPAHYETIRSMGIDVIDSDVYTNNEKTWQDYVISLSSAQTNNTHLVIQCGALASNISEAVFYDRLLVTTLTQKVSINPAIGAQVGTTASVTLGILLLVVLAGMVIMLIVIRIKLLGVRHPRSSRKS